MFHHQAPRRQRPQKIRTEPTGDDGGSGRRERTRKSQERKAPAKEKEEEQEQDAVEEDKVEGISEKELASLAVVGKCPQQYDWTRGYYPDKACGKCGNLVSNGFNCKVGSHYVCLGCVNQA